MSLRAKRSNLAKHTAKSGETLLEVLLSVSILMLIMAPASGLFIESNRNTAMNRNELIAGSLTRESLSMMRNFRDTNAIRFSAKFADCWNTKPEHKVLATCDDAGNKIGDPNSLKNFRLSIDPANYSWKLEEQIFPLSNDLNGQHDSDYRILQDIAAGLYNHTAGTETPFYRVLEIEYPQADVMRVISKVLYRVGSKVHKIELQTHITNKPL